MKKRVKPDKVHFLTPVPYGHFDDQNPDLVIVSLEQLQEAQKKYKVRQLELINRIEKEVIGEDTNAIRWQNPITGDYSKRNKETKKFSQKVTSLTARQGNLIKAEQRKALNKIRSEIVDL